MHMLELDSGTEAFFLNFTLALAKQLGARKAFQNRVDQWLQEPGRVKIYHGKPPPEVQRWRSEIRKIIWPEDDAGAMGSYASTSQGQLPHHEIASTHEQVLAQQFCWDHCANGDGRLRDEIQHWCLGPSCCPHGLPDTLAKLRGPQGIMGLARGIRVFPRKPWHGQGQSASHIILLEATRGTISQCFKPVEATARLRAEMALANLQQRRMAEGAVDDDDVGLAGRMHMEQEGARIAEENRMRSRDVMKHILMPGALKRMLLLRIAMEPFRHLKSRILHRESVAWHAQASGRQYPVTHAFIGSDPRFALALVSRELLGGAVDSHLSACKAVSHMLPSGHDNTDLLRHFLLMSRGGAGIYELVFQEQQEYPWNIFGILEDPTRVEEVFEDAEMCSARLDPLSQMHIKKYHSAELLRSPESLVELTGLALTIHEHTGGIERGHAESKRDQRTKDQTHRMKVHDSSAHRALTFYRKEWKEWHGGIAASHPTTSPGKIGRGSDRPQAQVAVQGKCKARAKAKAGAKRRQGRHSRRKRKVSRRGAWMAVNAAGRMITAQDHADYARMILDPSEAQRYDRIAAQMSRGPPRRRQRPSDYVFRKRREAKKRAELEWNPVVERQRLNEENRTK